MCVTLIDRNKNPLKGDVLEIFTPGTARASIFSLPQSIMKKPKRSPSMMVSTDDTKNPVLKHDVSIRDIINSRGMIQKIWYRKIHDRVK